MGFKKPILLLEETDSAYIYKFTQVCRGLPILSDEKEIGSCAVLPAASCIFAKTFWYKQIQAELFPTAIRSLTAGQPLASKDALSSLNLFLYHQGILRIKGRLQRAPFPCSSSDSPRAVSASALDYRSSSRTNYARWHATHPQLSSARVLDFRARSLVKSVIHSCITCGRPNSINGRSAFYSSLSSAKMETERLWRRLRRANQSSSVLRTRHQVL